MERSDSVNDSGVLPVAVKDDFVYKAETRAGTIKFETLCKAFERARTMDGIESRIRCIFTREFRTHIGLESSYPWLRLLLPQLDGNLRGRYGVREKTAAAYIINKLGLRDEDALRLRCYSDSDKNPKHTGSFARTLQDVLEGQHRRKGARSETVTVAEINERLDQLVRARSNEEKAAWFYREIVDLSPQQVKWLVQIIFQDLKIGLKHAYVFDAIHKDMMEEYNRTTNLRKACSTFATLRSTERVFGEMEVGVAFKPMLAAPFRADASAVEPCMRNRPFVMDMKVDGERMMCHKDGNAVRWLTRSINDYSDKYGPALTQWILKNVRAERCILDGEVAAWDDDRRCLVEFGHNRTVAREFLDDPASSRRLFFILFDVMHAEGEGVAKIIADAVAEADTKLGIKLGTVTPPRGGTMTELPLAVRRSVLKALITEEPHRLEIIHHRVVASRDPEERRRALVEYFDTAIESREEGLVVKSLASPYRLGDKSRKWKEWVKMKPETMGETDDLDVIVLGGYHGKGTRRSGILSHFCVGVKRKPMVTDCFRDDGYDGGYGGGDYRGSGGVEKPTEFIVIGRVGIGYSMKELEELNRRTEGKWRAWEKGDKIPDHFWGSSGRRFRPSGEMAEGLKIIKPEDSFVLQLKIADMICGHETGANVRLRFPRVKRIRNDKEWYEIDDEATVMRIYREGQQKGTGGGGGGKKRRIGAMLGDYGDGGCGDVDDDDGGDGGAPARKRGGGGRRRPLQLAASCCMADTSGVEVEGDAFVVPDAGVSLQLCVLHSSEFALAPDDPLLGDHDGDCGGAGGGCGGGGLGDRFRGLLAASKTDLAAAQQGRFKREHLERMIKAQGGVVLGSATSKCAFVVVSGRRGADGRFDMTTENYINTGKFNVVHFAWLVDCYRCNAFREPTFSEYYAMDEKTTARMLESHDAFGDHLTEPITPRELKALLDRIPDRAAGTGGGSSSGSGSGGSSGGGDGGRSENGGGTSGGGSGSSGRDATAGEPHWRELLAALEPEEQEQFVLPTSFFWIGGAVFYVDQFADLGSHIAPPSVAEVAAAADAYWESASQEGRVQTAAMRDAALWIEFRGGAISRSLHAGVTHVIVDRRDMRRAHLLWERLEELQLAAAAVVDISWIHYCVEAGETLKPLPEHVVSL